MSWVVSYCRVIRVGDKLFPDYFNPVHGIAERHGDDYYDCYHHGNRNDTSDDFFLSCVIVAVRRLFCCREGRGGQVANRVISVGKRGEPRWRRRKV